MNETKKLYVVSTPIGNLEDITFRAVRVLKEVDLIAAEDTRHTRKLLSHYGIHTPLVSFHQNNEIEAAGKIVDRIKDGKNVALVSDAGTPAVSDPGFKLVRAAIENGVVVEAIPGASAAISALAVSGLPTDQFLFAGFLPDKEGKRRTRLAELKEFRQTLIFYVSKWKIEKVLADMAEIFGDRKAVICRELTKLHEEIIRGTLPELLENVKGREIKGEITLLVAGGDEE